MNTTVIIPSLNPDEKLNKVIRSLLAEGFTDLLLVNDGSDEAFLAPFAEAAQHPEVTVLTHPENYGKGRALKTAFAWCLEHRPEIDGVVTVDGDGQHLAADVRRCAEAMAAGGERLWLGVRDFSGPDVPKKSRAGNTFTRGVMRVTCGVRVTDTQTGLRAMPRSMLPLLCRIRGDRFEYETEMLLEVHRNDIPIGEVTIETVYIEENRTSHYRPLRDSLRISRIIFRYLSIAMVCFLVDQGLFALVNLLLLKLCPEGLRLIAATVGARLCSSLLNFLLNRRIVFHDHSSVGGCALRYYTLAAVQLAFSYGLVYLLSWLLKPSLAGVSALKMLVDILLFFLSYQVQLLWVFHSRRGRG